MFCCKAAVHRFLIRSLFLVTLIFLSTQASAQSRQAIADFFMFQYGPTPTGDSELSKAIFVGDVGFSATDKKLQFSDITMRGNVYRVNSGVEVGEPTKGEIIEDPELISQVSDEIDAAQRLVWSLPSDENLGDFDERGDFLLDYSGTPDKEIVIDADFFRYGGGTLTIRTDVNDLMYIRVKDGIDLSNVEVVLEGITGSNLLIAGGDVGTGVGDIEIKLDNGNWYGTVLAPQAKLNFVSLSSMQAMLIGNEIKMVGRNKNVIIEPVVPPVFQDEQTITVFTPEDGTTFASTDTTNITTEASSGLPVSLTIIQGPGQLTGNTLSFTGSGTVLVEASQPGNEVYKPAPPLTNAYNVIKTDQVITNFVPADGTSFLVSDTTNLTATATSGLQVSFAILSGPGEILGGNTLVFNGPGAVEVVATQTGDAIWNAATPVSHTYNASSPAQSIIDFTPTNGSMFVVTDTTNLFATATSGLPVSFTVVSGPGQIAGENTLTFNATGIVSVAATQSGDALWDPAVPVTNMYLVGRADQVITDFTPPSGSVYTTLDVVTLSANASSGLPVNFSVLSGPGDITAGNSLTFNSTGTVVVAADQPGNNQWNPAATVTNIYTVSRSGQVIIDFLPPSGSAFEATETAELSATATSGLPVSFNVISGPGQLSGSTLSFSATGTVEVVASQAGNTDWEPAVPVTNTYTISASDQVITDFTPTNGATFVATDSAIVQATASSGLRVKFTVLSGPATIVRGIFLNFNGAGPVEVQASQEGNDQWNAAVPITHTYNVDKASQVITDFTPTDGTTFLTTDSTNLSATASSSLPVSFIVVSGPGIITGGNTLSFTGEGVVQVEAAQAGNDIWDAALPLTNTYTVTKANQSIFDFTPPDGSVFLTTDTTNLTATATSGLPVSFRVVSGNAEIVGENALRFTGTGAVQVEASQNGNSDWNAAVALTNTYNVSKADQVITDFNPPSGTSFVFTDSTNLSATATSGLPVSFAVISGPGSLSGNTLSFSGSGTVLVEATQNGDADWNPATPLTNTYNVGQADQSIIDFVPTNGAVFQEIETAALSATASSGLPVSFNVTSGPGSISAGNILSFSATGTVVVEAAQAGDADWSAATPVSHSYTVVKSDQIITNFLPEAYSVFETVDTPLLTADASSGLPVTFTVISGPGSITNGNTLTFSGSGEVEVEASQAGDADWNPADPLTNLYVVGKTPATIIISNTNQVYTGSPVAVDVSTSPTGLPVAVVYDVPLGRRLSSAPTDAGTYTVYSGIVGDPIYQAFTNAVLIVEPADQSITGFTPPSGTSFLTTDTATLAATATSGFEVTFSIVNGPGVITSGNVLSFTDIGTVEVEATQAGDQNWNPATPVTNTYSVTKNDQTITGFIPPSGSTFIIGDTTNLAASATSGLSVGFNVVSGNAILSAGNQITFTETGTVLVEAFQTGDADWNPAVSITNSYTVVKDDQVITDFTPPDGSMFLTTDSAPLSATASSGLPASFEIVNGGPGVISGGNILSFTSTGTVSVAATQDGNEQWNAAVPVTNTYTITKDDQTISGFIPADGTSFMVTDITNLMATASSGLDVSFAVISGPGTIVNGNELSFTATGTVSVEASQAGNNDWNPAVPVTNTYTVGKADQNIVNFTPTNGTAFITSDTTNLSASATSGLDVSFSVVSGPGLISGANLLSFTADGLVEVVATQSGDDRWNPAPMVTNIYSVTKADQAISDFLPPDGTPFLTTDTTNLTAMATSGLEVSFAVASGNAVLIGGNTLSFSGDGPVEVVASQGGDAIWNAALSVTNTYPVSKTDQVIDSFAPTNGSTFLVSESAVLSATATSGLKVEYRLVSGPGSISERDRLSFTGTGTVLVEAVQSGDAIWNAAVPVTNTYNVVKANQTIDSFTPPDGTMFLASETTNLSATASSGLPVTFSVAAGPGLISGGNELSFTGAGTVQVVASQSGNNEWNAALSVTNSYTVSKADQVISGFTPPDGSTFLTTATTTMVASASSGLNVRFEVVSGPAVISGGNTLNLTGEGAVEVRAFQNGDEIWNAAEPVTNTYNVVKDNQTISGFTPASGTTFLTIDFTNLNATASSGLDVVYTVVGGPGVITAGNRLSFSGAGTVLVEASQPGDDDWYAAPPLTNSYNVVKAEADVFLLNLDQAYNGNPRRVFATTLPIGLSVDLTYDGDTNAPVYPGSYTVVGTIDDVYYTGSTTNTLTVEKGEQFITQFQPPTFTFFLTVDTTNLSAQATSGLPVSFEVVSGPGVIDTNDWTLSFTTSGTVAVAASQMGDTNWNAAIPLTNTYSVGKTPAVITISNTNQTYTGLPIEVDTSTAPTGLPVSVIYNIPLGLRLSSVPVDVGVYAVSAGVVDDPIYQAYTNGILTIEPADQVITNFMPVSGSVYQTTNTVALSAGATSGLDVEFAVVSGQGSITGNILTFSGSGEVRVEATQPGDRNWNPAPSLTNTYTVINTSPNFTSIPIENATEDVLYSYLATTDDIDGDTVIISAPVLPSWLTLTRITLSSSALAGIPRNSDVGTHSVVLVGDDGRGGSVTQSFNIVVANVNDAPIFTSIPVTLAALGVNYTYTPFAIDIEGDPVTITAPTIPGWMSFDGTTLSGIPPTIDTNAVVLIADDGNGGTATQSFEVVVNDFLPPPILMSAIDITSSNFLARWKPAENATGYFIDVSTSTNFTMNTMGYDNLYVGDVTSVLVTGLTANTVYYYQLRAEYISISSADSLPSDPVLTSDDSTFPLVDYTNAVVSVGGFDYLLYEDLFKGSNLVVELVTNTEPGRVEAVLDSEGILLNYLDLGNAVVEIRATAPNGSWTRLPIELTIVPAPILDDSDPVAFNLQNGLFEQTVYVFNRSLLPADTVTLTVSNLSVETSLYNATGINIYGNPEIKWVGTLPGGGINAFVLQFYTTEPIIPSGEVTATLNLVPPDQLADRDLTPDLIISASSGPNRFGEMVVEFSSVPGEVYYVQYTDNLLDEWQLAYPAIMAITARSQWIDSGPPFTATLPSSSRFYRIVQFEE